MRATAAGLSVVSVAVSSVEAEPTVELEAVARSAEVKDHQGRQLVEAVSVEAIGYGD